VTDAEHVVICGLEGTMNLNPQLVSGSAAPDHGRRSGSARSRLKAWQAKAAPFQAALLVFAISAGLIGVVAYTLDRNARRSTAQQATTELASGSRVAASTFSALRADLRARAGQVATSLELQRAVLAHDKDALMRIAVARRARIVVQGHSVGTLAPKPRIASTAAITANGKVLAQVTISVALGKELLVLIRQETPLPPEAALMLAQNGRVIAGGPHGARVNILNGRLLFGKVAFAAQSARLVIPHTQVVAVEPLRAIAARGTPYRRRLFIAAIATLILAAALATRLGRPVSKLLNDVARLSRQAQTDALTGVANRRSLDERLDEELARARLLGTSVSFVLADVDNFKQVNDRYGHQCGDEILRAFAQACGAELREVDLAGRWGGEEFALILPSTRLEGALQTAERVRRAVGDLVVIAPGGEPVRVTASFGAAAFPTFGTAAAMLEAADGALYEAKRTGKNRVVLAAGTPALEEVPQLPAKLVASA
jgi:diguanylate cyclase (GGDEF)-like protein